MKHSGAVAWLAVLLAFPAFSEVRVWTGTTGSQFKGELVSQSGGIVVLRDENGRELKVPRTYLSLEDIEYLELMALPIVVVEPEIRVHSEYRGGIGVVQAVRYSIEIRKVSSDPYLAPLSVSLCLVGTIGDKQTYTLLQKSEKEVRFAADSRNLKVSGPDLSLGSPELQNKYDVQYVGYLIVLAANDGRVLAIESDSSMLKDYAEAILGLNPGDLFGEDMKLLE